ncbi:hypothetical protein SNE40_023006 [Patella caerulea]
MKVAILGHSFVRRLEEFSRDTREKVHPEHDISYHGRSGSQIENIFSMIDDIPESTHLVFIQSGGNDINPKKRPASIASAMVRLAERIVHSRGIPVLIGSVFVRPKPRYQTAEDYDKDRKELNSELKHILKYKTKIRLSKHEKFFRRGPEKPHMLDDGVHLNPIGQKLFMLFIRKEIDKALRKFYTLHGPNFKIRPNIPPAERERLTSMKSHNFYSSHVPYKRRETI